MLAMPRVPFWRRFRRNCAAARNSGANLQDLETTFVRGLLTITPAPRRAEPPQGNGRIGTFGPA
jgi:hypothetical protein